MQGKREMSVRNGDDEINLFFFFFFESGFLLFWYQFASLIGKFFYMHVGEEDLTNVERAVEMWSNGRLEIRRFIRTVKI